MRGNVVSAVLISAFTTVLVVIPAIGQERRTCPSSDRPSAVVVAIGGAVTVTPGAGAPGAGEPRLLALGEGVCPGDAITTGAASRVELQFERADTTTGASSNTTIVIPTASADGADIEITNGLLRFISSVRGLFTIRTPYQDAGIEGTEALLAVDGPAGDSLVLVGEGDVTVTDRLDRAASFHLARGEASFAGQATPMMRATPENVPPRFRALLLNPEGASDWAIYYPPVLLAAGVEAPAVRRAAELLDGGDPDGAEAMLVGLSLPPRDAAAALSLRAVASVFRNKPAEGMALADAAVERAPELAAGHLARSYALQASGRLEDARDAAARATEVAPDDAFAWARLAELHLTLGERRKARRAVQESLARSETALGRTIEGFAALSAGHHAAAETALHRAIEIDSEAPLARLGLGLSAIRQGRVAEGRREIETAVALDPRRASLRTWLGRAYFEEGLGERAAAEFALALQEDPDDANAAFFSALQLYTENRPIEALRAVEAAQERTAGRAVIRSRAGLGEDRAVQGAALGRLYDVLGLEQRAIAEGSKATDADPSNPAGHRFLADIFRTQPNAEIVQSSELLKADLLDPPSKTPLQPQRVEADLALLDTTGPTRVTFSEFAPLFDANGVRFDASGFLGTQETLGDEAAVAILHDGFALKLGQFYYETDGYRRNNDVDHLVLDAQAKVAVLPGLDLFAEYRHRKTTGGDRELGFDIDDFDPSLRQEFERDLARFGFHAEPGPRTDIIGVFTWGELDTRDEFIGFFGGDDFAGTKDEGLDFQLSAIQRFDMATFVVGGHYSHTNVEAFGELNIPGFPPFFPPISAPFSSESEVDQYGLYAYANFTLPERVDWTLGASYNVFDDPEGIGKRSKLNPKFGARARVTDDVAIRAVYARTLKPLLISEQLLEPTTIMGFNQFTDVINGAVVETFGGAIDADVTGSLRVGLEATAHWWDNPTGGATTEGEDFVLKTYAHKTFGDRWAVTAGVRHEDAESNADFDLDDFTLTSVPVSLRYFDPSGFFGLVSVEPAFHDYRNDGRHSDDEFLMLGATLGYRLPNGHGVLSVEAQNLLDEKVRFQDRSLRRNLLKVPRFAPELTVVAKATLQF